MDTNAWLAVSQGTSSEELLANVNEHLSVFRLTITLEDAQMPMRRRTASLAEIERIEFGNPAILTIPEAIASSPCLSQGDVAASLATLQDAFYDLRDELPVEVPDTEIAEALRGCLDAWGDAATVATIPVDEDMGYSKEYVRAPETASCAEYRICMPSFIEPVRCGVHKALTAAVSQVA